MMLSIFGRNKSFMRKCQQQKYLSILEGTEYQLLSHLLNERKISVLIKEINFLYMKKVLNKPLDNNDKSRSKIKPTIKIGSQPSLNIVISKLFVSHSEDDIRLALNLFGLFETQKKINPLMGQLNLLQGCIDKGYLDSALQIFYYMKSKGYTTDKLTFEKLILQLAKKCRFKDVQLLLLDSTITDTILLAICEPFVMSGKLNIFSSYVRKYFKSNPPPSDTAAVNIVIKSIIIARFRRMLNSKETTGDEMDGVSSILGLLSEYDDRGFNYPRTKLIEYFHECEHKYQRNNPFNSAQFQSPMRNIYEELHEDGGFQYLSENKILLDNSINSEKFSKKLKNFAPIIESYEMSGFERNEFRNLAPKKSSRSITDTFPSTNTSPHLKIRDLSYEINRSNRSTFLLYHGGIFPNEYRKEMDQVNGVLNELYMRFVSSVMQSDMMSAFYGLRDGAENSPDDDEDDDDDDDDDDDEDDLEEGDEDDDLEDDEDGETDGYSTLTEMDHTDQFDEVDDDYRSYRESNINSEHYFYNLMDAMDSDPKVAEFANTLEDLGQTSKSSRFSRHQDFYQSLLSLRTGRVDFCDAFFEDIYDENDTLSHEYSLVEDDNEEDFHPSSPNDDGNDGGSNGGGSMAIKITSILEDKGLTGDTLSK